MNLVIVQARLGSSRLPNKVLLPLGDEVILLEYLVERIKKAKSVDKIVIAITTNNSDEKLLEFCKTKNYEVFRGSNEDCLDRHYQCALKYNPNTISKVPSDVPFIDPLLIDDVIKLFNTRLYDFVSTLHPPTFPDGMDIETFSFDALEKAWTNAKKDFQREHTTPYLWDNPEFFKIGSVKADDGKNYFMDYRWTIDYKEDLVFMNAVYDKFISKHPEFNWKQLVDFLDQNPSIASINSKYNGTNWYGKHINELKTFDPLKTIRI